VFLVPPTYSSIVRACLAVVGGVGEATNATGLPTAARRSTQRFGDLTFGISLVLSQALRGGERRDNEAEFLRGGARVLHSSVQKRFPLYQLE
jgi:hypothetical protein